MEANLRRQVMTVEIDITMQSFKHDILVTERHACKMSATNMADALEELAKRIRNGNSNPRVEQMDWSLADLDNQDTQKFLYKNLSGVQQ
jgi:hypothetical protein